ncbi:MAG TPA: LipL32 family surface lipoprotein [Bacteroidia bacterium]|nr:LipL32 family surface lipoprotein [Bacteroidia bacterium]
MKKKIILLFFLFLFCLAGNAQRLDRFAMSRFAAGGESGVAYPLQKNFFGKLPTDTIPSYTRGDTTFYFVYVWLPEPVRELGVQLISPVPEFASAAKGDYETEDYHDSLKAAGKYFDPQLLVERVLNINFPEEIFVKGNKAAWRLLGRNDNSAEAPAHPSLKKNNSLFRTGITEKDTSPVPAGLYCITIAAAENKKPEGTFVLQVGGTEQIPGLKIFRRADELSEGY